MIKVGPRALDIVLSERQLWALQTNANEVLFGGGACSGKSLLTRVASIKFALEIPGLQVYLFRRSHRELQSTHFEGPAWFPVLLAELAACGGCTVVKNEIRFANGSRIVCCHCLREVDKYSYQGAEVSMLCVDELSHFTESIYRYLRTRMRLGNLKIPERYQSKFPLALLTSNPGGIGHQWVRESFVDNGPFKLCRMPESEGGCLRQYIPSTLEDLRHVKGVNQADLDRYRAKLMGTDPDVGRGLLSGDWDIVAGSVYGNVWRRERHVIEPRPIPLGFNLWRSADDGYDAPAAVLWWARHPGTDRYWIISELYRSGMLPDEMARLVNERDRSIRIEDPGGNVHTHDKPLEGAIDSSAFANTGTGALARGDRMKQLGCKWRAVHKDSDSRSRGVQRLHELLKTNLKDGLPQLQVFSSCENLVKAIPTAPRDEERPEDIDPAWPQGHLLDAARYGLDWKGSSFKTQRWAGT